MELDIWLSALPPGSSYKTGVRVGGSCSVAQSGARKTGRSPNLAFFDVHGQPFAAK